MKLLTIKEAAERLAISPHTVRAWIAHHKIEIVRIGRCIRIREQVIDDIISTGIVPPK